MAYVLKIFQRKLLIWYLNQKNNSDQCYFVDQYYPCLRYLHFYLGAKWKGFYTPAGKKRTTNEQHIVRWKVLDFSIRDEAMGDKLPLEHIRPFASFQCIICHGLKASELDTIYLPDWILTEDREIDTFQFISINVIEYSL